MNSCLKFHMAKIYFKIDIYFLKEILSLLAYNIHVCYKKTQKKKKKVSIRLYTLMKNNLILLLSVKQSSLTEFSQL